MYNANMTDYRFTQPIVVRYGDLDPQGHVNNAGFITYMEHARMAYIQSLGLWDGISFLELGFILARLELDYKAPILMTDAVEIGVRVSDMEYLVKESNTGQVFAKGKTVQVTYDYQEGVTIPIPKNWRNEIRDFEKFPNNTQ
jgi:acyl-CoA thioester hydrolase